MIELGIYLISAGLVVIGALGLIRALAIPARVRMIFACLAAAVPVAVGFWLFRSSGLHVTDLDRLIISASEDIRQTLSAVQDTQTFRKEVGDLGRIFGR